MTLSRRALTLLCGCLATALSTPISARRVDARAAVLQPPANAVTAGAFTIEPATLICLGFDWDVSGDANHNASVKVSYRAAGQTAWSDGMPLLRMGGEKVFRAPYTVPDA